MVHLLHRLYGVDAPGPARILFDRCSVTHCTYLYAYLLGYGSQLLF